eukprot:scaffold23306_cov125-Isochrysis_galbana.AAC.5
MNHPWSPLYNFALACACMGCDLTLVRDFRRQQCLATNRTEFYYSEGASWNDLAFGERAHRNHAYRPYLAALGWEQEK